jgi:hypothetical protein
MTEADTISHAQDAGLALALFSSNVGTDPQRAIEVLQDFGSKVTDTFNKGLGDLISRLDEFSAMIFLEAARAFDPSLAGIQPSALLDVILLNGSAAASVSDDFLKGTMPDATAIGIEQPVVGVQ